MMREGQSEYWILDGKSVAPVKTSEEWLKWLNSSSGESRVVGRNYAGRVEIETIFYGARGCKFETSAYTPTKCGWWVRDYLIQGPWTYETWDSALEGHRRIVTELRELRARCGLPWPPRVREAVPVLE